jgi:nucleoid-associated protein YgaU
VLPRSGPAAVTAPGVRPSPQAPAHGTVVVRPGDSLWALAEASLRRAGTAAPTDRAVAQAWPQWWSANRAVIGDDPDLLLPGTVLRPPTGSAGPH